MMYKLYKNEENKILLDMSYDRQDIIETLGEYITKTTDIDYSIIRNKDGKDKEVARIISVEDYKKHNNKVLELKK